MDSAEFHAAVCCPTCSHRKQESLYSHSVSETVRYMTLYDAFLPAALQAMVRFLLSSRMLNIAILLRLGIARTHSKVDWNAQLFSTRWSRWGKILTFLFDLLKLLGQALKFLPSNTNPPIPWHRVIGSSGTISSRGPGTIGAQLQHDALQAEGVEVTTGRNGEMRVNLREFGWFPSLAELNLSQHQDDDDDDDGSEA